MEEMAFLLKMCQMLQAVDSERRQTELHRQLSLRLCHHHPLVSTLEIMDTFFSSFFFFLPVNAFVYETDVISCDLITYQSRNDVRYPGRNELCSLASLLLPVKSESPLLLPNGKITFS